MKKRILSTALALLMCLSMLPTTAFAAEENDANGDGYHDGDVAVINGLIENNGLNWVKDDIENWSGISWGREKYRVEGLYLSDLSRTLLGELDVSALTALTVLHCTHEDITALDVSGNTALTRLLLTGTDITELDISKNAALTELKCDATPLLTITVPSSYKVGETMQSDEALNYALPTPRRVNYIFNGWYTAPTGGKRVEVGDTFDVVTTLYSQWSNGSIPEVTNYTVSFDSDGGSAVTAQTVAEGGKVTKPADPTKVKHVFDGWYGAYGVAGEDVFNDVYKWDFDTDTVTGDITLYAKWDAKDYAVEFNSEGGSAVASQYVDDGGKLVKPADPTKSGHTFGGWYKDKIITDTYTIDIDTADIFNDVYKWNFDTDVVEGDFTLHAKWTQNTYTGGGGGGSSTTPVKPEDKKDEEKKDEEQP
ncbi:MAG: InlB B-repeat-containing protein, partial [Oscillospiraceae bacterium]|nr:InlB B-repeat-containing protein [Oscillospiraceae bacterium]